MGHKRDKDKSILDVIIETPKGHRNKYAYDKKEKAFRLKKIMPVGAVFPYDFGFIPHTKGGDGDPLDILVMMDEPAFPGCIIECRIVGILKARQTEKNAVEENDRLIGVSVDSNTYAGIEELKDINKNILDEIQHFFVSYNKQAGKEFMPLGWGDSSEAMEIIEKSKT